MTTKQLIKKTRFYGNAIGLTFSYNGEICTCIGALFYEKQNKSTIYFNKKDNSETPAIVFELPNDIEKLKKLRRPSIKRQLEEV